METQSKQSNYMPLIAGVIVAIIVIITLILVINKNNDSTSEPEAVDETTADNQTPPYQPPPPEAEPEDEFDIFEEEDEDEDEDESDNNGLPADWDSLSNREKAALNPFGCDHATQWVSARTGRCINKPVPEDEDEDETAPKISIQIVSNVLRISATDGGSGLATGSPYWFSSDTCDNLTVAPTSVQRTKRFNIAAARDGEKICVMAEDKSWQ